MINRRGFLQAASAQLAAGAMIPGLVQSVKAQDVFAQNEEAKVDRRARLARHSPVVRVFDSFSALSVGNGGFAFTVDATGKPAEFTVKSVTETALAVAVVDAVKQWRFKPAMCNGAAVETKVLLPVKIVDDLVALNSYASK